MHYAQLLYACTIFNTNIHAHWRLTTMRKCGIISLSRENKKRLLQMRSSGDCDPCPLILPFLDACFKISFLKCSSSWGAILYIALLPSANDGQNTGALKGGGLSIVKPLHSTGRIQKGGLLDADSTRQADKLLMICWLLRGEADSRKLVGWLHIPARGMHSTYP